MSEFMHIYCIYIRCISQALLFKKDLSHRNIKEGSTMEENTQNSLNWSDGLLLQLLVSSTLVQLSSPGGSEIAPGKEAQQSLGLVERKRVNIGFDNFSPFQTTGKLHIDKNRSCDT